MYKSLTNKGSDVLKVHFHPSGICWAGMGDRRAEICPQIDRVLDQFKTIRIAGTPSNWEWIGKQTDLALQGRLEVVGSSISRERQENAAVCIASLRCPRVNGFQGGPFRPKARDLVLFSAGHRQAQGKDGGELLDVWYRDFPVSKIFRWIPFIDRDAFLETIATIVDPRLWIPEEEGNEHSCSRLEQWFGLTPTAWVKAGLWAKQTPVAKRLRLLTRCWYRSEPFVADHGRARDFLCRIVNKAKSNERGVVHAGQVFLRLLRHSWMVHLYPNAELEPLVDGIWKSYEERAEFAEVLKAMKQAQP